jgi:endonuclease/exonuclease/phosphatase (EEP) superfamily protein YafD
MQDTEPTPVSTCRIRRAANRLLLISVFGWAVFLLAHVILAGRWWLWIVPEDLPPILMLIVPLLLLALVFTRLGQGQRQLLLPAVLVTLIAGTPLAGLNPNVLLPQRAQASTGSITVFSWNADYWDMGDDAGAFLTYLRKQDADVYLLTEYLYWRGGNGAESGPVRIDKLAELAEAFPGYRLEVDGELLTMSRVPVVAAYAYPAEGAADAWYWQGRKAQRIDLRVGGKVLSVYNVHLPQPLDLGRSPLTADFYRFLRYQEDRRQTQFRLLREELAANRNPILLAGDFNSSWMGTLVRLRDDLRREDPTSGSLLPISFSELDPLPPLWRLDWVFTTKEVAVSDYHFVSSEGLSDHVAQRLRISVS